MIIKTKIGTMRHGDIGYSRPVKWGWHDDSVCDVIIELIKYRDEFHAFHVYDLSEGRWCNTEDDYWDTRIRTLKNDTNLFKYFKDAKAQYQVISID